MKTFKGFLTEAAANTHMTHIEDLVLYGGVDGARNAINALRSLRDMLNGHAKVNQSSVTVKWDGAPAVVCGPDPKDGKFFVAKKGIFNKNPKYYKTDAEIDADIDNPDLNNKMKVALRELSKIGLDRIVQGDVMYTSEDLKVVTIDGEKMIEFHPNTIAYAVPLKSDLGKRIQKSKIGIVFHTEYRGDSIENLSASFGVNIDNLRKTPGAWVASANIPDLSGEVTMTQAETAEVNRHLSNAGRIFRKINSTVLKDIETIPNLARTIETFNNKAVREGRVITDTKRHVEELVRYIDDTYQKAIDKLKSERGKARKQEARDEFMAFFSPQNKKNIKLAFDLQKAIVEAKLLLINKLSNINQINKFIKTKNGYQVTGDEGFVAIDHLNDGAVKLVDRMEFSSNNFNPDVIKGWDSVTRG